MYWLIGVMTLAIAGIIIIGVIMELQPAWKMHAWLKPLLGSNLLLFIGVLGAMMFLGADQVMASPAVNGASGDISVGMGLAMIGVGIPTALSTLAAAYAVGSIGAASLAVLAERPEMFGRTLIYLGLAEGIAIYGLVISILLLDKI